ncbi:restriction endonuclease subunit S [Parashewanella curva]|uniref:Restriction endonuclease subunit S n=1 Tax=Parashewanella curva TaxID=2338552 RepID=A0A3L8PXG5_9GAMM|nr:restriction endonuclease subunit S [Parashewanella curva]RLV60021.1 restriction endonuclease subunit S [Parashewanella curva]
MSNINNLITDNIADWTLAVQKRNATGRGSSKKIELYGITKLRELILELAVRGKLVPQNPEDEPASVLLERIATEKAGLIKTKKIRKAKVVSENEMPPVSPNVPAGWGLPTIEELLINSSDNIVDGPFGSRLKASEYTEVGIPLIRIQNIDRNNFKMAGVQYLSEEKAAELERHSFTAGDIVLNKLGEPTGKVCIVPHELEYGIIVADLVRIRVNSSEHNKQYLVNAMNSPFVARQFSGLAKGVTRQRVNLSQVRSLKLPLPPLSEQHRIVAKVNELMCLCDQLEQQTESSLTAHVTLVENLLATLTNSTDANELEQNWQRIAEHFTTLFTTEESIDQLKQTVLQLAVMGKLVPQDPNDEPASVLLEKIAAEKAQLIKEKKIKNQKALPPISEDEKPFNLPNGWEWARLSDIANVIDPNPSHRMPKYVENGIPFISTENFIANDSISFEIGKKVTPQVLNDQVSKFDINEGAFAMSRIGTIGKTRFLPTDRNFCMSHALCVISPLVRTISEHYLRFVVSAESTLVQAHRGVKSIGVPDLGMGVIRSMLIPIPPAPKQHRIVIKVDQLMTICNQLKTQIQQAQQTRLHLADAMVEQALGE